MRSRSQGPKSSEVWLGMLTQHVRAAATNYTQQAPWPLTALLVRLSRRLFRAYPCHFLSPPHLVYLVVVKTRHDETRRRFKTSLIETCSVYLVFRCTTVSSRHRPIKTRVVTSVTSLARLSCLRKSGDRCGTNPPTHSLTNHSHSLGLSMGQLAPRLRRARHGAFPYVFSCLQLKL
jgi:hypothetical protein